MRPDAFHGLLLLLLLLLTSSSSSSIVGSCGPKLLGRCQKASKPASKTEAAISGCLKTPQSVQHLQQELYGGVTAGLRGAVQRRVPVLVCRLHLWSCQG